MFNYVEKIKPEIKEDQLFQDGLSRIKKVQIILFSIFIVLTIATLLMSSGPKDLNTVANIVMRLAVIVLLSTGYKKLLKFFYFTNIIGFALVVFLFIAALFISEMKTVEIIALFLQLIVSLSYVISLRMVLKNKEMSYVTTVSDDIYREEKLNKKFNK